MTSAQGGKEELIADFSTMVKELLHRYLEKNGDSLPESLIYWRDGVGESQFKQILESEVSFLKGRNIRLSVPYPILIVA